MLAALVSTAVAQADVPWASHADCSLGPRARQMLVNGLSGPTTCNSRPGNKHCLFEDVIPSIGFPHCNWVQTGNGQGNKSIIAPRHAFKPLGRPCVVYGAGIAGESDFEQGMTADCEVHAFDCTVGTASPVVTGKNFTFHQTCIGESQHSTDHVAATMRSTSYMGGEQGRYRTKDAKRGLDFEPLRSIRQRLGHERIDLLKFDIEGFEWELFRSQILRAGALRPGQISFELHLRGTPAMWVPPSAVRDADKRAVAKLFLDLFDLGYRVVSKDPNGGVHTCAEFVVALGCPADVNTDATKRGGCFYDVSKSIGR